MYILLQVLELIIKWLRQDWENRSTHAPSLLRKVRLGLVPEEILKQLMDDKVLEIPECKELFEEVLKELRSEESTVELAHKHPNLFATRSTITVSS